jgi:acetyl-CoA acetyltransferase
MEEKFALQMGLEPLGAFLGFAIGGCEPDEMGTNACIYLFIHIHVCMY